MDCVSFRYNLDFLSGGCNDEGFCVSWSKKNDIAYGCGTNIIILRQMNTDDFIFNYCISFHEAKINLVKFLAFNETELLITSDSNNNLLICQNSPISNHYEPVFNQNYPSRIMPNFLILSNCIILLLVGQTIDQLVISIKNKEIVATIIAGREFTDFYPLCACTFKIYDAMFIALGGTSNIVHIKNIHCDSSDTIKLNAHDDWVKSISIVQPSNSDYYLLATASQDRVICIWKIEKSNIYQSEDQSLLSSINKQYFIVQNNQNSVNFSIKKESLLISHEAHVSYLEWLTENRSYPRLLSIDMDEMLLIWEYDNVNKLWNDRIRFGCRKNIKLGYLGCAHNTICDKFITYGKDGVLHLWVQTDNSKVFIEKYASSGHFDGITDMSIKSGTHPLIATCSCDMTVRVYGLALLDGGRFWVEVCRPVVHGHSIQAVCWLSSSILISAASEKPIRLHKASKIYFQILKKFKIIEKFPDVYYFVNIRILMNFLILVYPNP
ncbi:hypothetical protein HZS_762 [Henneguya salminicola]|nr:hypothetical protein HZS_762 [Henneguya salminicola]